MNLCEQFVVRDANYCIEAATVEDFPLLVAFYDDIIAATTGTENDPQWVKDVHPSEKGLLEAIQAGTLWVCRAFLNDEEHDESVVLQLSQRVGCSERETNSSSQRSSMRLAAAMIIDGNQACGYEKVAWRCSAAPSKVAVIHLFATHPVFQKQGLSQRMLKFAERVAVQRGAQTIRLDVISGNEVVCRVYERAGYCPLGVYRLDYDDIKDVDFYLYDIVLNAAEACSEIA